MAEQFQIFLRKPGEEPTPIDVNPTDTIQDIKSRHNISNAKLFVGRKFLKNATTLQEKGVTAGMTLNAFTNKVPSGFGSMGEYKSAQKLKHGEIKSSRAHSHLHDRTQSVVMAESSRLSDQAKEYHKKTTEMLIGIEELLKEASHDRMPSKPDDLDLMAKVLNIFKVEGMNAILKEF